MAMTQEFLSDPIPGLRDFSRDIQQRIPNAQNHGVASLASLASPQISQVLLAFLHFLKARLEVKYLEIKGEQNMRKQRKLIGG